MSKRGDSRTSVGAWFPLYVGDYLADTLDLTAEEHGAYLLLLMHQWKNGHLPNHLPTLARIGSVSPKRAKKVLQIKLLSRYFKQDSEGLYCSPRLEAERVSSLEKKRAYIERAQKGGRAKAASSTASSRKSSLLEADKTAASRCAWDVHTTVGGAKAPPTSAERSRGNPATVYDRPEFQVDHAKVVVR